jgi:hypothetical protein
MYGQLWTSGSNAAAAAQLPSKPGPISFAIGFGIDRRRPFTEISEGFVQYNEIVKDVGAAAKTDSAAAVVAAM